MPFTKSICGEKNKFLRCTNIKILKSTFSPGACQIHYVEVSAPTHSATVTVTVQLELLWEGNVKCFQARTGNNVLPLLQGVAIWEARGVVDSNTPNHPHEVFQAREKHDISLAQ